MSVRDNAAEPVSRPFKTGEQGRRYGAGMRSGGAFMMVSLLGLAACGGERLSPDGTDGAAVGICRKAVNSTEDWSSTVRDKGTDGFVVSIWRQPRPSGDPDYVCEVRRDPGEPRGLAIKGIQPPPAP
jgi:hypothetical protein